MISTLEERLVVNTKRVDIPPRVHLGANCPSCGLWVGRSRGNLKERRMWINAVNAMMKRHMREHHAHPSTR